MNLIRMSRLKQALGSALLAWLAGPGIAGAETVESVSGGFTFSGNGFYTVAAAKAVRVRLRDNTEGLRCHCFVTEYSQGGVHEDGRIGYTADSKLGLQGRVETSDGRWSATGQIVARGARDGRVNLEWLYATYEINGNWTAQLGRKRLPLLSQSEVQDVGLAIPWVRLPTQLYGWDIVNYNGANLLWRGTWGPWAMLANAYGGAETVKDSPYEALYYTDGTRVDSRWSGIRGFELEAQWGDLKLRAASLRARSRSSGTTPGQPPWSYPSARLRISTLAASFEPGAWTFSAERLYGDRRQEYGVDKSWSVQAGRRFGDVQIVLAHSSYRLIPSEASTWVEGDDMSSVVLRWNVAPNRALKLQFDDFRDKTSGSFSPGSRRLITLSYSGLF
jgi:hypothetical protein